MSRRVLAAVLAVVLHGAVPAAAQLQSAPVRYVSGALPVAPPVAVSGGEVVLDVLVAADGHVSSIRTVRTTPPFTDAVIAAVGGWQFTPTGGRRADDRPVLVAAMFTAPVLEGPTVGELPKDVATPALGTPSILASPAALYPPRAVGIGAVLIEATIDGTGPPASVRVIVSSPAFDGAALAAAKSWSFVAVQDNGGAATRAYLLFVFQQPVIGR
jgi:TonB family protein